MCGNALFEKLQKLKEDLFVRDFSSLSTLSFPALQRAMDALMKVGQEMFLSNVLQFQPWMLLRLESIYHSLWQRPLETRLTSFSQVSR